MQNKDALMNAFADLDKAVKTLNANGISVDYSLKKQEKEEFTVMVTETYTTTVKVKAISPDSAKDMVRQMITNGAFLFSPEVSDIDIYVL